MGELNGIQWILTDIEGTTTEISFVYNVLFPFFREHLSAWENNNSLEVDKILLETQELISLETGRSDLSRTELFNQLRTWSIEDRKVSPLKELQGMVWKQGFDSGELKGHVYSDVRPSLERWQSQGINLAVFSSGSITAQKQLFGHSIDGDLTPFFQYYFDTKTGAKREADTYRIISKILGGFPPTILFLSDVVEELMAAEQAGFKTIQLLRPGTAAGWPTTAENFNEIK